MKKFIFLICVVNGILLSENKNLGVNKGNNNTKTVKKNEKQKNTNEKDYLEWQVFFSAFYDYKKKGQGETSTEEIVLLPAEKRFFKLSPIIRKRFLSFNDKNIDLIVPVIPEIPDIIIAKNPINIDIPLSKNLPDMKFSGISSLQVENINITRDREIELLDINIFPKFFADIVVPTISLAGNANGYNNWSTAQNLYTNFENFTDGTMLASNASQTALVQFIGTEGTNNKNLTSQTDNLSYVINTDIGTNLPGSRIIAIESHRGEYGSSAGDPNQVISVITTGNLMINTNNAKAVEIEQGYAGRGDSFYINKGNIISSASSYNIIGIDFIGGGSSALQAENWGKITLNGNTSIGIEALNVTTPVGIVNKLGAEINLYGDNSYGIYLKKGNLQENVVKTATNLDSSISFINKLIQDGEINLYGKNSYGVAVLAGGVILPTNTILNNGLITVNGDNSTGLYQAIANKSFINTGKIEIYSENSNGVRVDNGTNINTGIIELSTETENSVGMTATNKEGISVIINNGKININSINNENIGMYGINGGLTNNTIWNSGEINLNLNRDSNMNIGVVNINSKFQNDGTIEVKVTGVASSNNSLKSNSAVFNDGGIVNLGTGSKIALDTSGNSIGVYVKNTGILNTGGSITVNNNESDNFNYGIYLDSNTSNTLNLSNTNFNINNKSVGIYSGRNSINFSSGNTINLSGNEGIGILYEVTSNSPVSSATSVVTNSGIINVSSGTGIYVMDNGSIGSKKIENLNKISVTDGGIGIVVNSKNYNISDNFEIINNGIIENTSNSVINNSIGIYSKNENIKVSGSGSIKVASSGKNVGLYANQGEIEFNSNIELGENGIGVYLNGNSSNTIETNLKIGTVGNEITQIGGTKSIGIVSSGEKANIIMGAGGLTLLGFNDLNSGSLGIYIENSNLDNSAGGIIKVGDNGAAVYLNTVDTFRTIKLGKLETGKNGIGLYSENSSFIDSIDSITTDEDSTAVYVKSGIFDSSFVDESKFYLGAGSNGYFLENGNLKSSAVMKNIVLGDNITGILMTGNSNLDSSMKSIKIGDKTISSIQSTVLGMENLASPINITTSLFGGDGVIGLYYDATINSNKVTYNGAGVSTPDIETGKVGGLYPAIGVYSKASNNANILDLNNTYLKANGDGTVALGVNGGTVNINGGKIEITGKGSVFVIQNNGKINISSTTEIVTPNTGVEIFTVVDSTYTNSSGTKIVVPNSSIGIFAKNSTIINEGEINSKIFSGINAVQSTGIFTENFGIAINKNRINLGDEGIGLFGYYSSIINDVTGTINIEDFGAGEYVTLGSTVENNGEIVIGDMSVGIYADDVSGISGILGIGKENKIKNTGRINSVANETMGIYSIGHDLNNRSVVENTGSINLTGYGTTGIYGERTNILNSGNITLGSGVAGLNYSLGIFGIDSLVTLNGGNISTGDYSVGIGVIANNEDSEVKINSGNIHVGENSIYNYITRDALSASKVSLTDTSGGIYDLNKINQFGIYTSEGDVFSNKTIYVREGTGSIGVYGKNSIFSDITISGLTLNVENEQTGSVLRADFSSSKQITFNNKIYVSGDKATGLIQEGGRVLNTGETTVIGVKSIGILGIDVDSTVMGELINTGNINVIGDSSVGIYGTTDGTGKLLVNNIGTITISDSITTNVGIYGEKNTTINNSGDLFIGEESIGIYANQVLVNQINGTINVDANGIGFYGKGGQIQATGSLINVIGENSSGFYGTDGAYITATGIINVGESNARANGSLPAGSFGYVGRNGSTLVNNAAVNLGVSSVGMYSDNSTIINSNNILTLGTLTNVRNSRIGMYGNNNSTIINLGSLETGDVSSGIYAEDSFADNQGIIKVGDTYIDPNNISINDFATGMYGYKNLSMINSGIIQTGVKGIGIYSYKPMDKIENNGIISSAGEQTVGVYIESGQNQEFINRGSIILTGNNSVGIAGVKDVKITNEATGVINLTGQNSVGIYADENITIENKGIINVTGQNGIGILMKNGSTLVNSGIINVNTGNGGRVLVTDPSILAPVNYLNPSPTYDLPSIINTGIIRVSEKFIVPENAVVQIKVDPSTVRSANPLPSGYDLEDINGKFLVSNSVKFIAPEFVLRNIEVAPDFSQGTNVNSYKLEEVFNPNTINGGLNYGISDITSKGIFWNAIPNVNPAGNLDIWMERIPYSKIAKGTWWEVFAKSLDDKYENAQGGALLFYDRLDMVENLSELNKIIGNVTGNVYSNINQREYDIARTFESSLNLLQNSKNNTTKRVKINIITGKGITEENTPGVIGYDYSSTGVLALKEVERNYKHTIGYSLGYLHTGFEFDDDNNSEEWVDTIQIGGHSKYEINDWILRNDLMGRASLHNIDRNVGWIKTERSEMNGMFQTYDITSDNILGRKFQLGRNLEITPYGAFRMMYIIRPDFEEKGIDALEVQGNDAWSIKPRAGFELKASTNENKYGWKLKGAIDIAYEYELANLNTQEKARLVSIEDSYHNLAKPKEEKGNLITKIIIGTEIEDTYGIFLTGEYSIGENSQSDYRTGITLKAVF